LVQQLMRRWKVSETSSGGSLPDGAGSGLPLILARLGELFPRPPVR